MARRPISRTLRAVGRDLRGEDPKVGDIVDRLGPEGLGLTLLLLALPPLIPIPGPVGMTFGTLMVLFSLQVMLGMDRLWLPERVRARHVPAARMRRALALALRWVRKGEPYLCEMRAPFLTGSKARVAVSVPVMLLGVTVALPIPFGNFLPALAAIAIGVGWVARDGMAVFVGLGIALAAGAWTAFLVIGGASALDWLIALV